MADYRKGGYQIIDISEAEVDGSVTISGLYSKLSGANGKPIMIKTASGGMVYAKLDEVGNSFVTNFTDGEGHNYGVVITSADNITVTKVDGIGDLTAIQEEVNNLSTGIENLTNADENGRVDEIEKGMTFNKMITSGYDSIAGIFAAMSLNTISYSLLGCSDGKFPAPDYKIIIRGGSTNGYVMEMTSDGSLFVSGIVNGIVGGFRSI